MLCSECGEAMIANCEVTTSVGYFSPEGHNHDDNCVTRQYVCKNGHIVNTSKRNKCSTKGCTWVGKESCDCHKGKKVEEWPK